MHPCHQSAKRAAAACLPPTQLHAATRCTARAGGEAEHRGACQRAGAGAGRGSAPAGAPAADACAAGPACAPAVLAGPAHAPAGAPLALPVSVGCGATFQPWTLKPAASAPALLLIWDVHSMLELVHAGAACQAQPQSHAETEPAARGCTLLNMSAWRMPHMLCLNVIPPERV